jgi:predicted RNA-binding Zn ribbon-like protein
MVADGPVVGTPHDFRTRDFVGGHPVVDFVNTVTARNETPIDWLDSFPTLLRWASLSALPNLADLAVDAGHLEAEAELRRCKELREALHATLTALVDRRPVPQDASAVLQQNWRQAAAYACLDFSAPVLQLRYEQDGLALSAVRRTLAAAAIELLIDLPGERLRRCPGERCGWFFLDSSKAGRRRWCDMATCGTADKNRRRRPRDGGFG